MPTRDRAGAGGPRCGAEVWPETDVVPSHPEGDPGPSEPPSLRQAEGAAAGGRLRGSWGTRGLGAAGDGGAGEVAGAQDSRG